MLTNLSTSIIGQKPVDTIFFSSYVEKFHEFSYARGALSRSIFYQNDMIHVKLDPKSVDISFLNEKA